MFNRLSALGLGITILGVSASPAAAKHHKGEPPEPAHHRGADDAPRHKSRTADDRNKNRGHNGAATPDKDKGRHGADDPPNHG